MIVVTGATGQLGRMITEKLLERVPASQIAVSVRQPEKADSFHHRGVRVRHGDFNDPSSLRHAFEGATQVLIVSSNSSGEDAVTQHRTAIEAARDAGAQRILYTSHMGANPASHFAPMRDHAATETLLQHSGIAFTALRNGFYADSALLFMGNALESGELTAPEDGPVSWTAHTDLAEAAAVILANEGRFNGITPLTNTEALSLQDIAALASELTGRTITRVIVPDETNKARLISSGMPAQRADFLMGVYLASRQHEFAAVDPTLASILEHPLTSMRDVLASKIATQMTA
jgi:uncharacterized protein YbjT (DUF2867 family)